MPLYQFTQTQKIPASLDAVWDFVSNPNNLKEITPPFLDFRVTSSPDNIQMYAGMIITYVVKPLWGLSLTWVTEITHIREKEYFVDEQRVGPYRLWHHQHKFQPVQDGVLMTDIVSYVPPFYFLGAIANQFLIRKKLKEIFHFRTLSIERRFGIYPNL